MDEVTYHLPAMLWSVIVVRYRYCKPISIKQLSVTNGSNFVHAS